MEHQKHANSPVLEALQDKLRRRMNEYADYVAEGMCKDMNEYRFITGKINGLAEAEAALMELDIAMSED